MKRLHLLFLLLVLLVAISLIGIRAAQAQGPTCTPSASLGCGKVTLLPSTLTADFYFQNPDEYILMAQQVNVFEVGFLEPGQNTVLRFDIRNIRDTAPGYGTLFVYDDTFANVRFIANQTTTVSVTPHKTFIRGTLNVTCDIRNAAAGDSIACQVIIDGAAQEAALAPGQQASYILDPGSHTVRVVMAGDLAGLWAPAARDQTVSITAGSTSTFRPRFDKKGHLTLALNQPGAVADFYLNGTQVAAQVATTDLWVDPNKSHRVEARNITDPAAGGIYRWRDASQTSYLSPAQARTVTLSPTREYLKGFLELTCNIKNHVGEEVACHVTIDGIVPAQDAVLAPAQKATYVLDPGSHAVAVTLTGAQSGLWTPATFTQTATISASATPRRVSATFNKLGYLIGSLDKPGAVGDWYLDGVQVGTQIATTAVWVTPGVSHTVEVKNILGGEISVYYHWKDARTTTSVASGQTRNLTVRLQQEANWVVPFELPFPAGFWTEGTHTYTIATDCPGTGVQGGSFSPTLQVSSSASLWPGSIYLRIGGPKTGTLDHGQWLEAIHPQQATIGRTGWVVRSLADAALFEQVCWATMSWDGNPAVSMQRMPTYQYTP